jgi:hypothetical protein
MPPSSKRPWPAWATQPPTPQPETQAASRPYAQAATALARALRSRGLVAEGSAQAGDHALVLVITPARSPLAEWICVLPGQGTLWFWWSCQPLCPADDINAAADKITHLLTAQGKRLKAAERMVEIEARWQHLPGGFHGERKLIKTHIQAVADTTLVTSREELCWLAIAAASAWLPRSALAEATSNSC